MTNGDNRRIVWVDAVRGIGIMLVVLGHMAIPHLAKLFIYSFHMPLFFFISGYLNKRSFSVRWCVRKFDTLIVPYWAYGVIIMWAMSAIGRWEWSEMLERMIKGVGVDPLWFLICLFFTEIIGGIIVKKTEANAMMLVIMLLMGVVGVVLPKYMAFGWFKIRTLPAALAFWLAGYNCKSARILEFLKGDGLKAVRLGALAGLMTMSSLFFLQRIDMNSARYGNGFLFYGTALSSIILLCLLVQKLERMQPIVLTSCFRIASYLGRTSLIIMCLHPIVPQLCAVFIRSKSLQRIVSLLILLTLVFLIDRHIPLLTGRYEFFGKIYDWYDAR